MTTQDEGYKTLGTAETKPNPTVGENLFDGLESIPEGFNPVISGSLCLDGLKSISEVFNPTVGDS